MTAPRAGLQRGIQDLSTWPSPWGARHKSEKRRERGHPARCEAMKKPAPLPRFFSRLHSRRDPDESGRAGCPRSVRGNGFHFYVAHPSPCARRRYRRVLCKKKPVKNQTELVMICASVAATRVKGTEPRAGKITLLPGEKKAILRKGEARERRPTNPPTRPR